MINVEEWAEIRRLHRAESMGVKAIARRLGVARNTVRVWHKTSDEIFDSLARYCQRSSESESGH